jgi:hypothetical protein
MYNRRAQASGGNMLKSWHTSIARRNVATGFSSLHFVYTTLENPFLHACDVHVLLISGSLIRFLPFVHADQSLKQHRQTSQLAPLIIPSLNPGTIPTNPIPSPLALPIAALRIPSPPPPS